MAIGAAAFSHLAVDHHWPWFAAVVVAGLIAAPIGALLAIPRFDSPVCIWRWPTLGFGILLQQQCSNPQSYMFGPLGSDIIHTAAAELAEPCQRQPATTTGPRNHHRGHGTGRDDQSQQAGQVAASHG